VIIKSKMQTSIIVLAMLFSGLVLAAKDTSTTVTPPAPAEATADHKTTEAPVDPIVMLKDVTTSVLKALKDNQAHLDNKSKTVDNVINQYIMPHVDFNEMALWVAGRHAWAKAPEKTREQFVSAFKVLVIRTYGTALQNYSNEVVEFPKQHIDTSKTRIQITSQVVRPNKDTIRLDYRLIKHENTWLVYDVIIEGVSILQGFQAQFSEDIKQQGLAKVVTKIQDHNKKGDS
jgi:phospholipid transport system substrate-binding protein